ncbi:shikimate kinase [Ruminococcus sp. FC2018]|uniref:shikimate kinase n=1 Tax=Ruminococcus sp. FC2018 TaxID=1410617 RepID=UPI00048FA11E|nr:shikimate kinase [Ruminococcus sp. FC2018]
MTKTVFLCGFMGCGKSTVGKVAAKMLGMEMVDLDEYIEQQEKASIPVIFSTKGEQYFRSCEKKAIGQFEGRCAVVATGGGAMLSRENYEAAKKAGTVIFIDTDFETCYSRIKDDPHRPIAYNSTKQQLKDRFEQRRKLYQQHSDLTVDGSLSPAQIAAEIKQAAAGQMI